jgi:hypothetical protein
MSYAVRVKSDDVVVVAEAADILGCSVDTVRRHVAACRLHRANRSNREVMSRGEVEALAAVGGLYPWRQHLHDPSSYWVTGVGAAHVLGITTGRLNQLADSHRLPYVRHEDGTRLYRRAQLEHMPRV